VSGVAGALLVAGAAWAVVAAAGVLRFDDTYGRMHAATKSTTLALLVVLAGAALDLGGVEAAKLALVGLLVLVTAPVGAHLIGRAVHRRPGGTRVRIDTIDELAADLPGTSGTPDADDD
jgi:multicomponent Na+:H+ antiporter subunit G